jgi:hypothetical protein
MEIIILIDLYKGWLSYDSVLFCQPSFHVFGFLSWVYWNIPVRSNKLLYLFVSFVQIDTGLKFVLIDFT